MFYFLVFVFIVLMKLFFMSFPLLLYNMSPSMRLSGRVSRLMNYIIIIIHYIFSVCRHLGCSLFRLNRIAYDFLTF